MSPSPCPHCGKLHPGNAAFCEITGRPLPRRQPRYILLLTFAGLLGVGLLGLGLVGVGIWLAFASPTPKFPIQISSLNASATATEKNALDSTNMTEAESSITVSGPTATFSSTPTSLPLPTQTATPPLTPTSQTLPSPTVTQSPTATPSPTSAALTGHIAFVSYRDRDEEIYIMNSDGSNQARLTYSQYGDTEPMLSPDGRFIVFVSQRAGGHKLFIMNSDGTGQHQLTDGKSSDEYDPYFSPDGQWVVYSSSRGGAFELWLIHPEGTGLKQLTSGPNAKNFPAWSPDGQWIAYNSLQNKEDVIKVIRPDGTDDQVILKLEEAYVSGWIGGRILFVAENGATTDIYSMNPDGSDVRQLTTDPANDKGAFGTPDGQFIIFNSARDSNDEVYMMRPDGSDQTRLTNSPGNDYMPSWGP